MEIQLFNLFQSGKWQLQIIIPSYQQQTNEVDCRIYAVENAFQDFQSRDSNNIDEVTRSVLNILFFLQ